MRSDVSIVHEMYYTEQNIIIDLNTPSKLGS